MSKPPQVKRLVVGGFMFGVTILLQATSYAADVRNLLPDEALVWSAKNFGRLLARATNEEAVEFGRVFSESTAYLGRSDPDKCIRMVMPSIFGPLRAEEWPKQYLDRQMAIQKRVVHTARTQPTAVPDEKIAGPIFDKALAAVVQKHGKDAARILSSTDKSIPAKSRCLVWSALYSELVKLPTDEAGLAIRWLNAP